MTKDDEAPECSDLCEHCTYIECSDFICDVTIVDWKPFTCVCPNKRRQTND